jgi:cytosine/adenosine deaminase-related metal-dependent hydrolase
LFGLLQITSGPGVTSGTPQRTFIEHIDVVVTCDPENRVISDATLVVSGDRIIDLGPTEDVRRRLNPAPEDEVISGTHMGVTPGFVDTHVHLSETLSRAAFPDLVDTRAWVFQWVMRYYGELTPDDEKIAVLLAASEMLRSGTTCFLDMGALNDPRLTVPILDESGIRGITGRHAADTKPAEIPTGWSEAMVAHHFFPNTQLALEELEACVRDLDGYGDGRIRCWVSIQGKEPCSPELHVGARDLAERLGVGTTYHIASSAKEARLSEEKYGQTPIARMESLGALGSNLVLAHAVAVTDEEIEILAGHHAKVAFCPGTALKIAKGATSIGRYPEMLEAGVTVGLGTDGVSASGNLNLMRQMYLVAGLFKDARMDPALVGARKAVRMATIDGARALGLEDEIGSLVPGKKADFVVFDLSHPEWVPHQDPIQALVWSVSPASILQTWVAGRAVFREGLVTTIPDEAELRREAQGRADALLRRAGLDHSDIPLEAVLYE